MEYTYSEDLRGRYSLANPHVMRDQGTRTADETVHVVIGDVADILRDAGYTNEADQADTLYQESSALFDWDDPYAHGCFWTVDDGSEVLQEILRQAEQLDHVSVEWNGDAGTVWVTIADLWEWLDDACTGEFGEDSGELEHDGPCPLDQPVPPDFPVQPLGPDENPAGKMTCGGCDRSWDDSIATGWTPVPSARCPFEYFHGHPLALMA